MLNNVWVFPEAEGDWIRLPGSPLAYPTEEFRTTIIAYGQHGTGNDESYDTLKIGSAKWNAGREGVDTISFDFTHSGTASVWTELRTMNNQSEAIYRGYNNISFSGGRAVIDYNASLFTLPQTNGEFTLTNIPSKHNGKYAILLGAFGSPPTALYGLKDAASATAFKGYPITGGTAEIPVFKLLAGDTQFSSYDGSDTVTSLVIIIQDGEAFDFLEYSDALSKWDGNPQNYPLSGLIYTNVPFTGGEASKAYDPAGAVGGLE